MPGADHLSAEARLVLLLARLSPSPEALEDAARLARTPGFRWDAALELACRLWVHPLLARATDMAGSPLADLPPPEVKDGLRLAEFGARIRWESYMRTLQPVFREWERRRIRGTLLKGAAIQATLFPSGSRLLNDVDVWVPPDHFDAAVDVLLSSGFTRSRHDEALSSDERSQMAALTFYKSTPGSLNTLGVDLHHSLFGAGAAFAIDGAACTAAGTSVVLGEATLSVFNREDAFVLYACHIAKDMVVKAQTWADLVALLESPIGGPDPDFAALEARALAAGAPGPTAFALRWAAAGGAAVPPDVPWRLENASARSRATSAVFFDLRAVIPDYRMRTVLDIPLRFAHYGPRDAGLRPYTATLRRVRDADRKRRRGWPVRLYRSCRTILLVAFSRAVARTSAGLLARGAIQWAGRVNGLLWRPGQAE